MANKEYMTTQELVDDLSDDEIDVIAFGSGDNASYIIKAKNDTGSRMTSSRLETQDDDFIDIYDSKGLIKPPFNPEILLYLYECNNTLMQCVRVMQRNIVGFGYQFLDNLQDEDIRRKYEKEIDLEYNKLKRFFEYVSVDQDFISVYNKVVMDLEVQGNAFLEVIRYSNTGKIAGFEYLPARTMRITNVDPDWQEVKLKIPNIEGRITGYTDEETFNKQFRKYCQVVQTSTKNKMIWFKEYGDPRLMDASSGTFIKGTPNKSTQNSTVNKRNTQLNYVDIDKVSNNNISNYAHEIIHFKIENPKYDYGIPRWIGNLLSVMGSRHADELNLNFFKNGAIFDFAILISGGHVAKTAAADIKKYIKDSRGLKDNPGIMIIQSELPGTASMANLHNAKIEIVNLNKHDDMMFEKYSNFTITRTRSSFCIPPIYLGLPEDYSKASVETSQKVVEEQVFSPERKKIDFWVNRFLWPELDVRFHVFEMKGPQMVKAEEISLISKTFEKHLSSREQRKLVDSVTTIELDNIDMNEQIDQLFLNYPPNITEKLIDIGKSMSQVPGGNPEDDISNDSIVTPQEKIVQNTEEVKKFFKAVNSVAQLSSLQKKITQIVENMD